MRKLMLYGQKYGHKDPQLIEGDMFRVILRVPEFGPNPAIEQGIIVAEVTPEVIEMSR